MKPLTDADWEMIATALRTQVRFWREEYNGPNAALRNEQVMAWERTLAKVELRLSDDEEDDQ